MTNPTNPSNPTSPVRPTDPILPAEPRVSETAPSAGHRWLTDGATPNPAPQPGAAARRPNGGKDGRDTATGCRDRASADLLQSLAASTANGRRVLESSAASWTTRAQLLQRIETGIDARRDSADARAGADAPDPDSPRLTRAEIEEDAAHLRL